jgi:thiamine-phosphate pyrophosphorylase
MYHKLQYISQGNSSDEHIKNIKEALDAGCLWIQLRMKNSTSEEIENTANEVRLLCNTYNAIFILNDNVGIAKNTNADGVHLGLTDMPVNKAREILGNDKIIGGTANSINDVLQRINENCNYIGLGPFRFTNTKDKLSPILGLEGYKKIISELNTTQLQTPIYAIGGILPGDVEAIIQTTIYGVAVSGIITGAENKKEMVDQIKNTLYANA